MSTDLATRPNGRGGEIATASSLNHALDTAEALRVFASFVKDQMKEGIDYITLPGTNKKCLAQPGAQKTALFFNAYPQYEIQTLQIDPATGHVEFVIVCRLHHRQSRETIGEGWGSCSTMEGRYRFRKAGRVCPQCGAESIITGKKEYGGGFICFAKKGGCGAKYRSDDTRILDQPEGQVENDNLWDVRNTVLKMGCKRAFVAACITIGCLSEMFTQDMEEPYNLNEMRQARRVDVVLDPDDGNLSHVEVHDPRDTADREARQGINAEFDRQRGPDVAKNHDNASGHGTGAYADPKTVMAFNDWVEGRCQIANTKWADALTEHNVEPTLKKHQQIIEPFQLKGHILKWARQQGLVNAPEGTTVDQTQKFAALVWQRDPKAVGEEYRTYLGRLIATAKAELGYDDDWNPCDPPDNDGCSDRPEDIDGPNA